jgi:hypothetical protein
LTVSGKGISIVAEAPPNRNVAPPPQVHAVAQHFGPTVQIITAKEP